MSIQWGRVLLAAFLMELVLFAIAIPLDMNGARRGTLMYVVLTRAKPEPWQYIVANAFKVVGGAAGGMILAQRRQTTNSNPGRSI